MAATAGDLMFEDVARAAGELTQSGDKVSILKVRERLGRGSFTTVKRFLDKWHSAGTAPAGGSSTVPPQLAGLWSEAVKAAEANLTAEREALDQLAADLQAQFEAFEARALTAEAERTQAEVRLADKDVELLHARTQIEALQATQAQTQAELSTALAQARAEREVWGLAQERSERQLQALVEGVAERMALMTTNFDHRVEAIAAAQAQLVDQGQALVAVHGRIEQKTAALAPVVGKVEEVERLLRQAKREARPRHGRYLASSAPQSKHGDTRNVVFRHHPPTRANWELVRSHGMSKGE